MRYAIWIPTTRKFLSYAVRRTWDGTLFEERPWIFDTVADAHDVARMFAPYGVDTKVVPWDDWARRIHEGGA